MSARAPVAFALAGALLAAGVLAAVFLRGTGGRGAVGPPADPADTAAAGSRADAALASDARQDGRAEAAALKPQGSPEPPAQTAPNDGPTSRGLRVRLVDRDGAPIPVDEIEAEVTATDERGRRRELEPREGVFVGEDLAPGRWWLDARADGFRDAARVVELAPPDVGAPGAPDTRAIELELDPAIVLRVRAVDPNGAPAFDHKRGWVQLDSARITAIATAEPPRSALLRDCPPGMPYGLASRSRNPTAEEGDRGVVAVLELDRPPPVSVSLLVQQAVLATQPVPPRADELTFVVEPGALDDAYASIRYRLVDADTGDLLLPSFYMLAVAGTGSAFGGDRAAENGGVIEHARVAPGAVQLTARVEGYEEWRHRLEVGPGDAVDLGDVPVTREASVAGIVVGQDGEPVVATVRYAPLASAAEPLIGDEYFAQVVGRSDADGRFELAVGRGRYRVWALLDRRGESWTPGEAGEIRSASVIVDTRDGRADGVLLRCATPLDVVVIDATGAFAGRPLRVFDADGFAVETVEGSGPRPQLLALQPGRYTLAVLDETGERLVEHGFELVDRAVEVRL